MPSATLDLISQGVHSYDGDNDIAISGPLWSGDADLTVISASAIRFLLPNQYLEQQITAATLTIRVRRGVPNQSVETFLQKHKIGILASATQNIPATGAAINSLALTSAIKTIGEGTFSPALDYSITDVYSVIEIDITAMLDEARTNGYLGGEHVVVVIQPVSYESANYLEATGIGDVNEPSLSMTWTINDVTYFQFDSTVITSDGLYLDCGISSGTLTADAFDGDNGLELETTSATPLTCSYLSGFGTSTLRFSLSRMVEKTETITLSHTRGAFTTTVFKNATDRLEYFVDEPVSNTSNKRGPVLLDNTETTSASYIKDFRYGYAENAETKSFGDNTPFVINILLDNSITRSFGNEIFGKISFSILVDNAYTDSIADEPKASRLTLQRTRNLFSSDLFGNRNAALFK
jgi:hypothetical protein